MQGVMSFYLLSIMIIVFAILAVTTRKILRAAVYLLVALLGTAGLYFLINYHFLAAVQLTVYAGGIVVLIIFSILLTSQVNGKMDQPSFWKMLVSGFVAIVGVLLCGWVIMNTSFVIPSTKAMDTSIEMIGTKMMSYEENGYVLPFEVISILLLAAMIAAIIIAKKTTQDD